MTNTSTPTKCRDCGSTDVEWRQSKAGKWYLAALSYGPRGSVYSTGAHFSVCSVRGPRAGRLAEQAAHNAKVEAERADHQAAMQAFADAGDWDGLRAYLENGCA